MPNELRLISMRSWMDAQLKSTSKNSSRRTQRRLIRSDVRKGGCAVDIDNPPASQEVVFGSWTDANSDARSADEKSSGWKQYLSRQQRHLQGAFLGHFPSDAESYKEANLDCYRKWVDVVSSHNSADHLHALESFVFESKSQTPRTITSITAGPTSYRLKKSERVNLARLENGQIRFEVSGLSPTFVGEGLTIKEAKQRFTNCIHSRFQLLCRMRPFQMEKQESLEWSVLERHIDVPDYWSRTPLKLIETGFIEQIDPQGFRKIRWLDGNQEQLPLTKLPAEFAALKVGQWFEAIIERWTDHYELSEIKFVQTIPEPHVMSEVEMQEWMRKLPSANLPPAKSSWDSL